MNRWKLLAMTVALAGLCVGAALAADVERVSQEYLAERLDSEAVLVVDARSGSDWKGSELKIAGAVRIDPSNVEAEAGQLPIGKELIVYCA